MARFINVGGMGLLGLIACLFTPALRADPPAPATVPMTATRTNAPAATPPPVPEEYFDRYGKILTPNNEMAHPIKLNLPFPDVGEVKIPSQDELVMRQKLEQLSLLSDDEIRNQLFQWPAFGKMSLGDEGMMLARIQQFRDRRDKVAQARLHDLGLLTLSDDEKKRFEKEYWDKKLQLDRDLARQFEPIKRDRENKMLEQLFREFSSQSLASPPGPRAAKPTPAPMVQTPNTGISIGQAAKH